MFSDTSLQRHINLTLRLVATLILFLAGCSLPAARAPTMRMPDSESAQGIKHHERLKVYGHRLPWTKTSIVVEEGDKLVIFASGNVTTHPQFDIDLPPYKRLLLKIGEGLPERAVTRSNQRYFAPFEAGSLMFAVRDWRSRNAVDIDTSWYRDNSGSYLVDVFVIAEEQEPILARTLMELALHNPEDELLKSQIDQFMEINKDVFYSAVDIASTPPNASVYLNGFLQGKTPLKLKNMDKSRNEEICVRFDAYHDHCQTLSVKDTSELYVKLKPKSSSTAKALVSDKPQARIARKNDSNVSKISVASDIDFGRYHALVIGNNDYKNLPKLKTAITDAQVVADTLRSSYGFEVKLLIDATRADILLALGKLRRNLTKRDNLLVYYAGHGWLDSEADEGYWLPIDAAKDNTINWISNSSITSAIKAIASKHVLIVADSCYSGRLARGIHITVRTPDYFSRISKKKARSVLSSGGLEPVLDSGGRGEHSVFASAFLEALRENKGLMDGTELFTKIRRPVMLSSDQTPEYSDIRKAGHEGGDFVFVRRAMLP